MDEITGVRCAFYSFASIHIGKDQFLTALRTKVHFSFFQRWQKTIDIPAVGEDSVIKRRVRNLTVLQGWSEETDHPGGINESGSEGISDLGLAFPLLSHKF